MSFLPAKQALSAKSGTQRAPHDIVLAASCAVLVLTAGRWLLTFDSEHGRKHVHAETNAIAPQDEPPTKQAATQWVQADAMVDGTGIQLASAGESLEDALRRQQRRTQHVTSEPTRAKPPARVLTPSAVAVHEPTWFESKGGAAASPKLSSDGSESVVSAAPAAIAKSVAHVNGRGNAVFSTPPTSRMASPAIHPVPQNASTIAAPVHPPFTPPIVMQPQAPFFTPPAVRQWTSQTRPPFDPPAGIGEIVEPEPTAARKASPVNMPDSTMAPLRENTSRIPIATISPSSLNHRSNVFVANQGGLFPPPATTLGSSPSRTVQSTSDGNMKAAMEVAQAQIEQSTDPGGSQEGNVDDAPNANTSEEAAAVTSGKPLAANGSKPETEGQKGEKDTAFKKFTDYEYEAPDVESHHVEHAHGMASSPYDPFAFSTGPKYLDAPYRPQDALDVYTSKHANVTQRPWVELFRPLYDFGPIPRSSTILGETNLVNPRWLVYGDWRTAMAYVDNGGGGKGVLATRLNLDIDLQFTSTERVHAFVGPLDRNQDFTRFEFGQGNAKFFDEFDADFDNLFFEGDLGALVGGATGQYAPFTLPFAVGYMPLVFQNGIWMEDNFLGAAVTIPARNSAALQWCNFDVTFFTVFDELNSPAFGADDSAGAVYGATIFIEAYTGYIEAGYAFLQDEIGLGRDYHNLGLSWTDRFRDWFSYSTRYILNVGQEPNGGPQTADGSLFLLETSLITAQPYTVVPYANFFVGLDRPQSVGRNGNAGGVLRNTGIVFESDFLTGYPTLDATANDVVGAAFGINLLGSNITHQWVVETAVLQTLGQNATRNARGDQYGFGVRYQRPINNAWLIRSDAMYGVFEDANDVAGARIEIRHKF